MCACSDGGTVATPCVDPTPTTVVTRSSTVIMITTADSNTVILISSMPVETMEIQSTSTISFAEFTSTSDMIATPTTNMITSFSTTTTSMPIELTTVIISTALLSPTAVSTTSLSILGTSPSVSGGTLSNTSAILMISTISMQSTPTTISPTPSPSMCDKNLILAT